jgi:hypothetical protein
VLFCDVQIQNPAIKLFHLHHVWGRKSTERFAISQHVLLPRARVWFHEAKDIAGRIFRVGQPADLGNMFIFGTQIFPPHCSIFLIV